MSNDFLGDLAREHLELEAARSSFGQKSVDEVEEDIIKKLNGVIASYATLVGSLLATIKRLSNPIWIQTEVSDHEEEQWFPGKIGVPRKEKDV